MRNLIDGWTPQHEIEAREGVGNQRMTRSAYQEAAEQANLIANSEMMLDIQEADDMEYNVALFMMTKPGTVDAEMEKGELNLEKIDPMRYKDVVDKPGTFDDAVGAKTKFERERWMDAINKELLKMEQNKVWQKIKRLEMPIDC